LSMCLNHIKGTIIIIIKIMQFIQIFR